MEEFMELETQDGVRMPWNVLPGTKQDSANLIVPIAAVYTPIKPLSSSSAVPVLPYSPLRCRSCRSVLNPFSVVDFSAQIWLCPICFSRNHFPPHYSSMSDDNLPSELFPHLTTVEYEDRSLTATTPPLPPVFMFVVDTCVIEEEMGYLRSAIAQAIDLLPDHAMVGLVTFGTFVHVHELGFGSLPKSYVFRGSKEISKDQIVETMGFFLKKPRPPAGVIAGARDGLSDDAISRFLLPASECEFALNSVPYLC